MKSCYPVTVSGISAVLYVPGREAGTREVFSGNCVPYQLVYKLNGKVRVLFDGKEYMDEPGTVRFVPKNRVHANYEVLYLEQGDCIDICFDTVEPLPLDCFVQNFANNKKMQRLFLETEKQWRTGKCRYYTCMNLLYQILEEMTSSEITYLPREKRDRLKPAVVYMNEHFREHSFDYGEPARISGVSETYFRKLFRENFGVGPKEYVTNLRISYACDLITSGMYSIQEIAVMAGYENIYYFSRVFKQVIGMSPSHYRNSEHELRMAVQKKLDIR